MSPTTLLDNLNSDFLAAISALSPRGSVQRVLVYVESDDDIAFWRNILAPYEKGKISFDIQLPIQNALEKGKTAVLKLADRVGTNLILCVDSDYDYLLQLTTPTSSLINSNEFIFQTYSYSIENLWCHSSSLHLVCSQASKNDTKLIDLEELMKVYSTIIQPLFYWSVYFSFKQDATSFTLSNFCEVIKILENPIPSEQFKTTLQDLKNRVETKVQELENQFVDNIISVKEIKKTLEILGVDENNVYLFAQGHTIKDNVVTMFLNPIFVNLRDEKIEQIKSHGKHGTQIQDEINHYRDKLISIAKALSLNTEFKSCFLYEKIYEDLTEYVQKLE